MLSDVCLLMLCGHLLGKLSFVMSNCKVVTHVPIGILDQVWCLIVSIPDLCPFFYLFQENYFTNTIIVLNSS